MQDVTQKQQDKKKEQPEWRSAADAFLRHQDGSEDRLSALQEEPQAKARRFLARELSKKRPLALPDAEALRRLLHKPSSQFELIVGAAILGGGGDEEAERQIASAGEALANEKLNNQLPLGVAPEKRMAVLEILVRSLASDLARATALELVAAWLHDNLQGKNWPQSPRELQRFHEMLCESFMASLSTKHAEGFWKTYTRAVPPHSLAESPSWRLLASNVASGEISGNLSASVRSTITSYLGAFRDGRRSPSAEGLPEREEPELPLIPEQNAVTGSASSRYVPVADVVEERPGYLSRLRAGRAGLEKLAALLEEVEQAHRLHQTARTEHDQARRELDAVAKKVDELARDSESRRAKAEELGAKLRARDTERLQLEEGLRQARGEASRFRDLLSERDADLSRSNRSAEELRDALQNAKKENERLQKELDGAVQEAARLRADRDRIASEHDKNVDAERRLTTEGVLAELRNRIGNVVSLQWDSALRLATTSDEREALELLKRRLLEITRGL